MTTKRTHSCNLCRRDVIDGMGIGVRWGLGDTIELTTLGQAETHVCQACINALENALEAQRDDLARRRAETMPAPNG